MPLVSRLGPGGLQPRYLSPGQKVRPRTAIGQECSEGNIFRNPCTPPVVCREPPGLPTAGSLGRIPGRIAASSQNIFAVIYGLAHPRHSAISKMPPKSAQPVQPPFYSTALNVANFGASQAKFPIALAPEKLSKQKLFFDCYQQVCAAFNLAFLPCFANLLLKPQGQTTSVTIHSAIMDLPSSLAIGLALAECADVGSLRIIDCQFPGNTLQNVLHFTQNERQIHLSFERMAIGPQMLDSLAFMGYFNRMSLRFTDCTLDQQALQRELQQAQAQSYQFLGLTRCAVDHARLLAALYDPALYNFSLSGIELFDAPPQHVVPTLNAIVAAKAGAHFITLARRRFTLALFTPEFQNLRFFDPATKKKYQQISAYAVNLVLYVRQQQHIFQTTDAENGVKSVIDGLVSKFLTSFAVDDEELVDYLGMNDVFVGFSGADGNFCMQSKLEYIGCQGSGEDAILLEGSVRAWFDGERLLERESEAL
ncbi:hypothetical protein SS50377_27899 [Spironucleus salmonicida]|uniref:Uncharacterized protein n=1 Tax=Spironucleus salmonicida TaxID=348837 RepID=A0A9P8RUP3_9EUKA|nr:hypothetical protein SS50377_27899 [Spironucleus salmonicida]